MSVQYTFTYDYSPDSFQTNTIKSLKNLFDAFDTEGTAGQHGNTNTGTFYNEFGTTSNTGNILTGYTGQYYAGSASVGGSATANYSYSIKAADGESLNYTGFALFSSNTTHTLYGNIESITFGAGLNGKDVADPFLVLDFSDQNIIGDIADGRANIVHDIVYGLMNSSTDGYSSSSTPTQGGLQAYLESIGIDLDFAGSGYLDTTDTGGTLPSIATLFGEEVSFAA